MKQRQKKADSLFANHPQQPLDVGKHPLSTVIDCLMFDDSPSVLV